MSYNDTALELKYQMDTAISAYIAFCTKDDPNNVDYSYINQDIEDAIQLIGGVPAREED